MNILKHLTSILIATLLATTLSLAVGIQSTLAVGPGDSAPPWRGIDLAEQTTIEFPQVLNGKPAVLIFWATWCPYCKAFMPYAGGIQADYVNHGVQIISFNAKERGRGDPKAYIQTLGFPLIAIADADNIASQYSINFIPGLLVVDGNGDIVYRRRSTNLPAGQTVSAQWDKEVRQVLDRLLQHPAN